MCCIRESCTVVRGGGLAQLGERVNGIHEVVGSSPIPSTTTPIPPSHPQPLYFVYILRSRSSGRFYIGSCSHLLRRFHQHQSNSVPATRHRGPWWMPYYEIFPTLSTARRRERQLKQRSFLPGGSSTSRSRAHTGWFLLARSSGGTNLNSELELFRPAICHRSCHYCPSLRIIEGADGVSISGRSNTCREKRGGEHLVPSGG